MIVIYTRAFRTNITEYWKQVPDIQTMCAELHTRHRLANYARAERQAGTVQQPFVAVHLDTVKPVMVLAPRQAYYAITVAKAERHILSLGNEHNGKLAVRLLNPGLTKELGDALKKLLVHDWIRLIDVSEIKPFPDQPADVYRLFALSPIAYEWVHDAKRNHEAV